MPQQLGLIPNEIMDAVQAEYDHELTPSETIEKLGLLWTELENPREMINDVE